MRKSISIVFVFVLASTVWAAEPPNEETKAHVRQAEASFNLGKYLESAKEYEAAYRQTLDANLLFNIGQAYRLAGERDKAITAYRSFIRSAPRSDQRGLAEGKIRELEAQRENAASAAPPTPVSPAATTAAPAPTAAGSSVAADPAPQEVKGLDLSAPTPAQTPPPFYKRWPFWTAVGTVVVGAAVVGTVLLTRSGNDLNMGNPSFGTKDY